MTNFPERLNFDYRRPRFLDPNLTRRDPKATNFDTKKESQVILDAAYSSYRKASDKANIIMQAASKVANKYIIPVDINSTEIRQAVSRQDPESGGNYIDFSLFVKMIEVIENQAKRVDYAVIDDHIIGDANANQRKITQKLNSNFDGLEDGLLSLLSTGVSILTLYLIHQINGIWRGPEKILAAHKDSIDQASPFLEAARETAIGLATAQVVLGIQQSLHYLFAKDGGSTSDASERVVGSIGDLSQVDLPPLTQLFLKSVSINDHKAIISYSLKYIAQTNDRGYEFWYAYFYARKTRYIAGRSIASAPMFSEKEFAEQKLNYKTDSAIVTPSPLGGTTSGRNLNIFEQASAEIASGLLNSVVTPTDIFVCSKDYESTQLETSLNILAQTLDTRVARDAICCVVRFLSRLDINLLRKIRILLGIVLNTHTIDLARTLENFEAFLTDWVRDTAELLSIELTQALMDKILGVVSGFIKDIEIDIGDLGDCPLIVELVYSILEGMDYIMEDIENLIFRYLTKIQLNIGIDIDFGSNNNRSEIQSPSIKIYKKRSLRNLLLIIDNLLSVLENNIQLCDEEEIESLRDQGTQVQSYSTVLESDLFQNLDDYLEIDEELKRTYFSDAVEIRLQDGTIIPGYDVGEINISQAQTANDICKTLYGPELLNKVLRRYEENKEI